MYPWVQLYNFILPSDLHYYTKIILAHAEFTLGQYIWWLLGYQENLSEEMEGLFLSNSHTFLLKDLELKRKYEEYLDINLIPEKYKVGKSYYDNYESIKKNLSCSFNSSVFEKIDPKIAKKIEVLFTIEASPALADPEVLKLLPKTYFIVLEWDILKDQALIYAERLKANGVEVEVAFYENAFHGIAPFIDDISGYNSSRTMFNELVMHINQNF